MVVQRRLLAAITHFALLLALSQESFANDNARSDAAALAQVFGDLIFAENVQAIRARAAELPPDQRFEFLTRTIFVESRPGTIRLAGEFGQTGPAPVMQAASERELSAGGEVVSPVYDLLTVAAELGRLGEVRDRVVSLPRTADDFQLRARASLRLLISLELGDQQAAEVAADELMRLVVASTPTTIAEMWPEMLAVDRAVRRHQADKLVADIATKLTTLRSGSFPWPEIDVWRTHMAALSHLSSTRSAEIALHPLEVDDGGRWWHPVERSSSRTRGNGYPQAVWLRSAGDVQHVSGHSMDYLFFRSPLRGNYEVEADLFVAGEPQFLAAGRILGMAEGRHAFQIGTLRQGLTAKPVDPRWGHDNLWSRYRAVVRDGTLTVAIDGRPTFTEKLQEHHDPWVAIHSSAQRYTRIRDIRISGQPEVPATVKLSADPDLDGWNAYHDETINVAGGNWRGERDEPHHGQIIADRNDALRGTAAESLLRYQRPLIEDGSVTYEFFYQPGETEAHPALDRLGLLLRPGGVSVHWITDGRYDTSGLGPENTFDEPACRRGPPRIPLRAGAWNTIELAVAGTTASLKLNDVLIYERVLEATNRRTFGLFRYADTGLRVRNVTLRGDWPTSVPATDEQAYADPEVVKIDARLPELRERFDHDFAADGFKPQIFRMQQPEKPVPIATASGLVHIDRSKDSGWALSMLHPTVEMHGDFDVKMRFEDLQMPSDNSGCGLGLYMSDLHLEIIRRYRGPLVDRVQITYVTPSPNGERRHLGFDLTTEALSGTLRIVRRGDTVSTLFADHDSTIFRVAASHTWENCGRLPATLDIRVTAHNQGRVQVTWKRFEVAAERLMRRSDGERSKPVVFTINADGTDLKQLTQPMPQFVWHGSPKWSPDGKRIAYDAWTGNAGTSRVFIMDADGGHQTDL